jgi:hypothetical protein
MDDSGNPVPQRVGDAERDQAVEFLREHLAQGRLDAAEFDDRLSAALNARIQSDLDQLFVDLPAPTPRSPGAMVQPVKPPVDDSGLLSRRTRNTMDILVTVLWPVTIGIIFLIGWNFWWLLFAPITASSVWGRRKEQDKAERDRRRKELEQGDGGVGPA